MNPLLEARMDFRMDQFNEEVERIRSEWGRQSVGFVLRTARKLVLKFAYMAPIDTGRLRSGFWPAAIALQVTTVYSSFPNANEGIGLNNTSDTKNPNVMIVNSVPYVSNAGRRGTGWWFEAINAVQADLQADMEESIRAAWRAA